MMASLYREKISMIAYEKQVHGSPVSSGVRYFTSIWRYPGFVAFLACICTVSCIFGRRCRVFSVMRPLRFKYRYTVLDEASTPDKYLIFSGVNGRSMRNCSTRTRSSFESAYLIFFGRVE